MEGDIWGGGGEPRAAANHSRSMRDKKIHVILFVTFDTLSKKSRDFSESILDLSWWFAAENRHGCAGPGQFSTIFKRETRSSANFQIIYSEF